MKPILPHVLEPIVRRVLALAHAQGTLRESPTAEGERAVVFAIRATYYACLIGVNQSTWNDLVKAVSGHVYSELGEEL